MKCLILLLPLIASACSIRTGGVTERADGSKTSWYAHASLGEDADAVSGGADAFAVVNKNQTKSFGRAVTAATTAYGLKTASDVSKAEIGRDETAIKESAATDRVGITEAAQTARQADNNATKVALEGLAQ